MAGVTTPASAPFQALLRSLSAMIARQGAPPAGDAGANPAPSTTPPRLAICVLPFANMSGDPEQEYFSDGISEDVITDLSKVSALAVASRNSAFMYKGKQVDVPKVARELKVSHVLEGSVRKAGGRVRITAQLVDGLTNDSVWAERYDRDLNDIFTLQDEISQAIVKALKLKLLPEEKKAIEQRGTDERRGLQPLSDGAPDITPRAIEDDTRRNEAIIRLCSPRHGDRPQLCARLGADGARADAGPLPDAEDRAMTDWRRPSGHSRSIPTWPRPTRSRHGSSLKAAVTTSGGGNRDRPASRSRVLRGQRAAAYLQLQAEATARTPSCISRRRMALMETDVSSGQHVDDLLHGRRRLRRAAQRAAQITLDAHRKCAGAGSRATAQPWVTAAMHSRLLGQAESAKGWMSRALLIDPDNMNMRYNFACALSHST